MLQPPVTPSPLLRAGEILARLPACRFSGIPASKGMSSDCIKRDKETPSGTHMHHRVIPDNGIPSETAVKGGLAADSDLQRMETHEADNSQGRSLPRSTFSHSLAVKASLENGAPTTQSPATIADPADNGMMQP